MTTNSKQGYWPKITEEIRSYARKTVLLELSCALVDVVKIGDPTSDGLG